MSFSRRNFLATAALSSASVALGARAMGQAPAALPMPGMQDHSGHNEPKPVRPAVPRLPVLISPMTGTVGILAAYTRLKRGGDTLDAALHVTTTQEDDPNDVTAGLGGLPNEAGEVQLDACCMHGPTRRAAAVASVGGIRNAALLARAVMDRTGYSLLTGTGAQRFALTQNFSVEDLTTDRTRKTWAVWKQLQSNPEKLGSVIYDPSWPEPARQAHFLATSQKELDVWVHMKETIAVQAGLGPQYTWRAVYDSLFPEARPLYVSAVNQKHEVSCVATTSGLPWRMPGAIGDVPVLGAGCYLDPDVGSAGASGNAEANIKIAGARTIVENMRKGMSPEDAGMDALHRIAHAYHNDMTALRFVDIVYYILRIDGAYGCVSLWQGDRTGHVKQFLVHDGDLTDDECLFLFKGNPPNGCEGC
jgi:N4-(beta-N-acetylglucosaminyl)-L-asparaginase